MAHFKGNNPDDGYSDNPSAVSAVPCKIPPPPPLPKSTKASVPAPPPPPLPPTEAPKISNSDFLRVMAAIQRPKSETSADAKPPFQRCHMFFYGSLMDPEVLQAILDLPEPPTMKQGSITGFSVKMWGMYPTLVRNDSGRVSGTFWEVTSEAHFLRLEAYETSAYTWCECDVELSDGAVLHNCRTFCWAGDPESEELEEGSFDLEWYQKYFKPSVTRRR
ncbi:uncharacterized protein EI97DRAFT_430243 [Westerdykella ornata]|uniref:Putative gamma-glutamylcyclotransferase n=1 Tax=Westerdykella ornata TaxID=318751 RepID=A0A6A6JXJ9_WESOR|nr:uncharacterized protein EI97DRAFT_430243 [Westerdykella ornata]KAF2280538.1 hypothetical protein EI97DRAFT_430243 [Westerdykella ornata]